MSALEQPPSGNEKKHTLPIDKDRHRRVKMEAVRKGVPAKELLATIIDHTLPLIESGQLQFQKGDC